jgi:pimeloyl-ACP methyl ester carboxylesterase
MVARVEERIPGARIVRMDDVGHWPLLEAPDVVAGVIRDVVS